MRGWPRLSLCKPRVCITPRISTSSRPRSAWPRRWRGELSGKIFFCNSGTEANEAALKLARRYQIRGAQPAQTRRAVAFEGSFHGRTMGSLSVTGQAKYREGFGPLVPDVRFDAFRRRRGRAGRSANARAR